VCLAFHWGEKSTYRSDFEISLCPYSREFKHICRIFTIVFCGMSLLIWFCCRFEATRVRRRITES
jgi:hypothetical protein